MTKNRIIAALVSFALILCCALNPMSAAAESDGGIIDRTLEDIIAFNLTESGADSIQHWIDTTLAGNAGSASENYILALHQSGEVYDYSQYSLALLGYLEENSISNAVTGQKYALALMAANCGSEYITSAANDTIGKLGVMSWVFGLHLLNNGCVSTEYTADDVIAALLNLRLADGGWAVRGEVSDADVTAMVIQSLAPYYRREDVRTALDGAVDYLASIQSAEGTYSSYGTENAESTAQVIIALSALGIDCRTDPRFAANASPLDGLLRFRLEDGSFSHTQDGEYSVMATTQAFCALTAMKRMEAGLGSLYVLDAQPDNTVVYEKPAPAKSGDYKLWAAGGVVVLTAGACALLVILKKHNRKNFMALGIFAAAALLVILLTDVRSASDYYSDDIAPKTDIIGTVTMTIRCDTIAGEEGEHIPEDGIILDVTAFDLASGETAYDILIEAARKNGIHVDTSGATGASLGTEYVTAINYTYEFDYGDQSGWVYRVNGATPSEGCGSYTLADGDFIEWHYSLAMGNDLT